VNTLPNGDRNVSLLLSIAVWRIDFNVNGSNRLSSTSRRTLHRTRRERRKNNFIKNVYYSVNAQERYSDILVDAKLAFTLNGNLKIATGIGRYKISGSTDDEIFNESQTTRPAKFQALGSVQ